MRKVDTLNRSGDVRTLIVIPAKRSKHLTVTPVVHLPRSSFFTLKQLCSLMAITKFPSELVFIIFQHLPKETLFECLFVCKAWRLPAIQLYYSEVVLSTDLDKHLPGLLRQTQNEDIGKWVRTLRVYQIYSKQRPLDGQELIALISRMPYLKQIDLNCFNILSHLNTLCEMDASLLENVTEIIVRNSFPNIGSHHLYTLINLKLCNTITHLRLENFRIPQFGRDKQRVMEYLSKFTSLEHLKIINDFRNGLADLDMISIFNICPNLYSLDLRSYLPAPAYSKSNYTDSVIREDETVINRNLHSLTLGIPDLSVDYFKYIAHHTPAHLTSFKLYTYGASFSDWVNNSEHFELLKLFASHMKNYHNLKINMESSLTRSINQPLADELLKNSVTCLWDFLYLIKGERNLFCRVALDIDNFRQNHLKPYINVQNNAILNIRSSLSYPQYVSLGRDQRIHWDSYFELNIPNAMSGLPFINSLSIDYTHFYSMSTTGIEQLVDCLLSRCHWLQSLFLKTNVSSLIFCPSTSHIDSGACHTIPKKLANQPHSWKMSKTQKNLRLISLENMMVSNYLLAIIATALPHIERLEMTRCTFQTNSNSSNTNIINIALDKIDHLAYFDLLLTDFDFEHGKAHICVLFESTRDMALLYKYCGNKCSLQKIAMYAPFVIPPQPEYTTIIHIQCAKIDTVRFYNPDDTKCAVLKINPWEDYCLMSDQRT